MNGGAPQETVKLTQDQVEKRRKNKMFISGLLGVFTLVLFLYPFLLGVLRQGQPVAPEAQGLGGVLSKQWLDDAKQSQ